MLSDQWNCFLIGQVKKIGTSLASSINYVKRKGAWEFADWKFPYNCHAIYGRSLTGKLLNLIHDVPMSLPLRQSLFNLSNCFQLEQFSGFLHPLGFPNNKNGQNHVSIIEDELREPNIIHLVSGYLVETLKILGIILNRSQNSLCQFFTFLYGQLNVILEYFFNFCNISFSMNCDEKAEVILQAFTVVSSRMKLCLILPPSQLPNWTRT